MALTDWPGRRDGASEAPAPRMGAPSFLAITYFQEILMVPKLQTIASACAAHSSLSVSVRNMLVTSGVYVVAESLQSDEHSMRIPVAAMLISWARLEEFTVSQVKMTVSDLVKTVL